MRVLHRDYQIHQKRLGHHCLRCPSIRSFHHCWARGTRAVLRPHPAQAEARQCMKRRDYRGHPHALIDAWFLPDEDLARYDPKLYWFDPDAATRVLDFFKLYCTHVEGEWAGKPLIPEQWQYQTLRNAFGWKNISDSSRKYRLV